MSPMLPSHLQPALLNILLPLRDYLRQLYQERFDRLVLFGSYARGEATANSDIDVLICLKHNQLISRFFLPKSRFETENSPFLRNIRAEGISL